MADELNEANAAKGKETEAAAEPDIADDEELDIEIQRVAPKRSGGCSGIAWVLVVVVLAAIAIVGGLLVKEQREKAAAEARANRERGYNAAAETISASVKEAADLAGQGDVAGALSKLDAADSKWETLATEANSANDLDKATEYRDRRAELKKALGEIQADRQASEGFSKQISDLEAQIKDLTAKRDAANAKICERVKQVAAGAAAGDQPSDATSAANQEATVPQ
ncbi:hypothetical protein LLH03_00535 [bacterium]|nr:hypothetical protein [bacterium]